MGQDMDLSVNLAGIILEHPLMNAAGTCRTIEEVRSLAKSATAAIVVGSITVEPREGNTGNVFYQGQGYTLNSLGLPNRGLPYYQKALPDMVKIAHDAGKPIFVSVAGFSHTEYTTLVNAAMENGVDLVELNLGCPNVWGKDGKQKRIVCFDIEMVERVLSTVAIWLEEGDKIAVKVSPFSDPFQIGQLAKVFRNSPVAVVTAVNTIANAYALDAQGEPCITPAQGLAGMAGAALKPFALGQVKQWREVLLTNTHLIGVGGITEARDILQFQRCGATAVQIASAYLQQENPGIFSTLLSELIAAKEQE